MGKRASGEVQERRRAAVQERWNKLILPLGSEQPWALPEHFFILLNFNAMIKYLTLAFIFKQTCYLQCPQTYVA